MSAPLSDLSPGPAPETPVRIPRRHKLVVLPEGGISTAQPEPTLADILSTERQNGRALAAVVDLLGQVTTPPAPAGKRWYESQKFKAMAIGVVAAVAKVVLGDKLPNEALSTAAGVVISYMGTKAYEDAQQAKFAAMKAGQ